MRHPSKLFLISLFCFSISCGISKAASFEGLASQEIEAYSVKASSSELADLFRAADEVCIGEGDISDSLVRAKSAGWQEFDPEVGSMFYRLRAAWLSGGDFPEPKLVLLQKEDSRAKILLFQLLTIDREKFIHHCEVIDEFASGLNEKDLRSWAATQVENRKAGNDPDLFDIKGGRFENTVSASANYTPADSNEEWPLTGAEISIVKSNHKLEKAE